MMEEADITQAMVLSRFIYLKDSGVLVWLRRPREEFESDNKWSVWNSRYAGTIAGSISAHGYRCINVFGKMRRASRLTWIYHYGSWPEVVDHIDGDIVSDRIENLRDVSKVLNAQNRAIPSHNKTGVMGVYVDRDRIRAQISAFGKKHYLGTFETIEEAAAARKEAERLFGFHQNHGREAQ